MRLSLSLLVAAILACAFVSPAGYAQQAPAPAQAKAAGKSPPMGKADAPRHAAAEEETTAGLIKAQTDAIKALGKKIEALEKRLAKLEEGKR